MNIIQNSFTIQDLEILSGVKAHNIRIWEKRYDLLQPERLNRNIRTYSLTDLQKILNVSLLHKDGYKISKLAKLSENELVNEVKTKADDEVSNNYQVNALIMSMYTFDEVLFEEIYSGEMKKYGFEKVFLHTYLPLLYHMGLLWQTDSIKPAHEHFISNLIYQKILLNTALIKEPVASDKQMFILFLPEGEIHELGLLFLNYCLKLKGEKTVYLGRDLPLDNLITVNNRFEKITWVSYFLIDKPIEYKMEFIKEFENILSKTKNRCLIFGKVWEEYAESNKNSQLEFYNELGDFMKIS